MIGKYTQKLEQADEVFGQRFVTTSEEENDRYNYYTPVRVGFYPTSLRIAVQCSNHCAIRTPPPILHTGSVSLVICLINRRKGKNFIILTYFVHDDPQTVTSAGHFLEVVMNVIYASESFCLLTITQENLHDNCFNRVKKLAGSI